MHVLLLGGHGKIALHLTPLLLHRGWDVTSVIRNPAHEPDILSSQPQPQSQDSFQPGKLTVLVSSLDDIKSVDDARSLLSQIPSQAQETCVIWAAGAGGKGGAARTHAIDSVAARHVLTASFESPRVKKMLMISHIGSRRRQPEWMSEKDWEAICHVNRDVLPAYAKAKLEADEYMTALAEWRSAQPGLAGGGFQSVVLRPGRLVDGVAERRVSLGRTEGVGSVRREDVAVVADLVLGRGDVNGWVDLVGGEEDVEDAVERVARDGVDAVVGEDVERMVRELL